MGINNIEELHPKFERQHSRKNSLDTVIRQGSKMWSGMKPSTEQYQRRVLDFARGDDSN